MKALSKYPIVLTALTLASAAFIYAGSCGAPKACGSQPRYTKAKADSCGSLTAAECATKCSKGCYCDTSCPGKSEKHATAASYKVISTEALKELLASGAPVTVVDARSGKYDDGRRIPGAISLPANASDAAIANALPDKHATIVTYCSNTRCPASAKLAARLVKLGYTNVHKYPDGIAGWTAAGNTVTTVAAK